MLYHKEDMGTLLAEVDGCISATATFGIGGQSLQARLVDVKIVNGIYKNVKLKCSSCSEEVKSEDAIGICLHCGELFPIKELVVLKTGGIYCKDCANTMFKSVSKTALGDLLENCSLQIGNM